MFVYLFNLIIVYFFLLLSRKTDNKVKKSGFILLSLLSLTTVAGIRYRVGTDFMMYDGFFFDINNFKVFGENIEPMFILFAKISHFFITESSVLMFFSIALFIYYYTYKSVIKNVEYYEFGIFLFIAFGFFTSSLNGIRQWMAIPLIYMLIDSLSEKKLYKSIIYTIMAYFCHKTSLILIPFVLLSFIIKKDKTRFIILVISVLLYLNYKQLNLFLYNILLHFDFMHKYLKYFTIFGDIDTNVLVMPMFSLVSYLLFYYFTKNKEQDAFYRSISNMLVFGFGFALLGTKVHYYERLQFYFVFALIYILPKVYSSINNKGLKKMFIISCIFLGVLFYIYSLFKNGSNPLPYTTVFNK